MIRIIENGVSAFLVPDQTLRASSIGDPPFVTVRSFGADGCLLARYQSFPDEPLVIEYAEEA